MTESLPADVPPCGQRARGDGRGRADRGDLGEAERSQRRQRERPRAGDVAERVAAGVAVDGRVRQFAGADRVQDDEDDAGRTHRVNSPQIGSPVWVSTMAMASARAAADRRRRRAIGPLGSWRNQIELAPGVPHVLADDEVARLGEAALALEHLDDLAVDEAAERVRARRDARRQQALHLGDDPGGELLVDATRDPREQHRRAAR